MGRKTPSNVPSNSRETDVQDKGGDFTSQEDVMHALFQHSVDNTRIVFLYGEVSEQSISQNVYQLFHLAGQSSKPIYLVVSSYGGSVDEMFCLYDAIKFLPCPVHTVALGKVMSAGVLLLAAGVKGKRMMGRSARLMIHPVTAGYYGNVFDIIVQTNETLRIQKTMVDALLEHTSMKPKQLEGIMKKGTDYYMTAEQAIEFGIVDKIIG